MSKSYVAIFAVCAIVSTTVAVAGLMSLGPYSAYPGFEELSYEPETQEFGEHNFIGRGSYVGPDDEYDEMFLATEFVMSFTDLDASQTIMVQAYVEIDQSPAYWKGGKTARYCFAVKTGEGVHAERDVTKDNRGIGKKTIAVGEEFDDDVWYNLFAFGVTKGDVIGSDGCILMDVKEFDWWTPGAIDIDPGDMPSKELLIYGRKIPHGSILKVEFQHKGKGGMFGTDQWARLASDETLLLTGRAKIDPDLTQNYEVGETAKVTVRLPYLETNISGSVGLSFYFTAYRDDTGDFLTDIDGIVLDDVLVTKRIFVFKIPIKEEYFSNDLADTNAVWFELYNRLYPNDACARVVVDVRAKAPSPPDVTFDKEWYEEGDTVTINWTGCEPNPLTNLSIVKTTMFATLNGFHVYRDTFPGCEGTTSFIAPMPGKLRVYTISYDSENRGSGTESYASIKNVMGETEEDNGDEEDDDKGFPLWEILLLTVAFIGAFVIVIFLAVVMNAVGVPVQYTMIGAFFVFLVLALVIAFVGQGAIDAVASYQAVIR